MMEGPVYNHRDLAACTSMAVNSGTNLALLAGRRVFGLIDLVNPGLILHKESRQSQWEVIVSEWSGLDGRLVAVGSNNKVELFTWTETELVSDTFLRSHSRVLTDLSWHTHDPNLLATSAADTYIYLWDRRDLRRHKMGMQAVVGAAKVQWNKVSGKYLASAHEGEVKLWDVRKGTSPVQHINAHLSRIYDIDWSEDQEDCLATSSHDSTVRFWNLANVSKAENTIKVSGAPVWRLQHTPFGSGLLTLVMHTFLRGENNLVLWNRQDLRAPIHTFYGHTDMVLNFGWTGQSQLVTWGKDSTLRLWNIDSELRKKCGQEVEEVEELKYYSDLQEAEETEFFELEEVKELVETGPSVPEEDQGAVLISTPLDLVGSVKNDSDISEATSSRNKSMNLNYEFSLMNVSDRLEVVAQDAKERLFTVSTETPKNTLILHVKFPLNYPNQKAPVFSFLQGTTVDNVTRSGILGKLRVVAKQQINRNRRCLEHCLRQFEASVEMLKQAEEEEIMVNNPQLSIPGVLSGFHDNNIPFPRSSGARFCGDGNLVCFGYTRQYSVPIKVLAAQVSGDQTDGEPDPDFGSDIAKTPRALTAMSLMGSVSRHNNGTTSPKYSMVGMSLIGQSPSQDPTFLSYKARVPRVRFSTQKSRKSVSSISSDGESKPPDRKYSGAGRPLIGTVTIYNCSSLLPYNKQLASLYKVTCDLMSENMTLSDICSHNATVCMQVERSDLVQTWTIAALMARSTEEVTRHDSYVPWAKHPLGRDLLRDLLNHHLSQSDVQTVAVLCSVFSNRVSESDQEFSTPQRKKNSKSECAGVEPACEVINMGVKHNRSNSDNLDDNGKLPNSDQRKFSFTTNDSEDDSSQLKNDSCLLNPADNHIYDHYILSYASLLYRWKLLGPRAELVKCLSRPHRYESYVTNVSVICRHCGQTARGPRCLFCHSASIRCALCRLPCRGQTCLCPTCGHGGHTRHLQQWFRSHDHCPTGCGCLCSS